MSTLKGAETAYGCLFCRTGNEKQLAETLQRDNPGLRIFAAEKLRRRRQGKTCINETIMLFPGYLFFLADAGFNVYEFNKRQDVFRVLHDGNGRWQLRGEDETFARELFVQNGVIGFSKAYFEGNRIRIVDGMLKACEGRILRVNKRAQTAQVSLGVGGQEITAWLGYELIESCEMENDRMKRADMPSAEKEFE